MSGIKVVSRRTVKCAEEALEARLHFNKGRLKPSLKEIVKSGKSGGAIVAIARVDGGAVGVIVVLPKPKHGFTMITREVHVFVKPEFRGQGVASALFEHVWEVRRIPSFMLNTKVEKDQLPIFEKFNVFVVPQQISLTAQTLQYLKMDPKEQAVFFASMVYNVVVRKEIDHVQKHAQRFLKKNLIP